MARAFVAKAIYNLSTTRQLLERLVCDTTLRRICGWESQREIPHESQFSRAFAEFAETELPQRLHQALIDETQKDRLIGHISRDSTEIEAREKPARLAVVPEAQALMNQQLQTHWPELLGGLAAQLNPLHESIFDEKYPASYYWTCPQSEWATDSVFRRAEFLRRLMPRFVRHGMLSFQSADVLRYLGHRVNLSGDIPAGFAGSVEMDLKRRAGGGTGQVPHERALGEVL
jgi:hypothetical protein